MKKRGGNIASPFFMSTSTYCPPEIVPGCFTNLIGISGCRNEPNPAPVLMINDIGITLSELEQYITGDYRTGEALFNAKLKFALTTVFNSLQTFLSPKYKAHSIISSSRAGQFADNKIAVPGQANFLKGQYFELINTDSYVDIFISQISLFTNFTGDIPIYFYDLTQDRILETVTLSSVAEEISVVQVNKIFKSNRKKLSLAIVYDSENITSYRTVLKTNCSGCSDPYITNQYLRIKGIKLPELLPKIISNIAPQQDTAGMSVEYSIQCNHSDYLCTMNNMIALPVIYRTAAELMEYALNISVNTRTNTTTTINRDVLKDRYDFYESKYKQYMKTLLDNILIPSDEKCFVCNQKGKHAVVLP